MIGTGPGQYPDGTGPGEWRHDPISKIMIALGSNWGNTTIGGQYGGGGVLPFVLTSADQFEATDVPPFPALSSPEFALAFDETKSLGGSGTYPMTVRSADDTFVGNYWAYDGTPSLCAPPRMYNKIATQIAAQEQSSPNDYAKMIAQLNLILADCGISCWHSKYNYKIWRPVSGIPLADQNGNSGTVADPNWEPYGAPFSNSTTPKVRFTPPFPTYPSGHATFGGGLFQLLRTHFGDDVHFTFLSDEYNGITKDPDGSVRPRQPRSFTSFSQAEEENGQSRIFLGIHWNRDKVAGIDLGNDVARWVIQNTYSPL
jgi:hypothetical protein